MSDEQEPEPRIECSRCHKRFDLSETYSFGSTSACMDCVQDEIDDVTIQWNHARFDRDRLRAACEAVLNWYDALDGDLDNKFGHDAMDRLRAALAKGGQGGE